MSSAAPPTVAVPRPGLRVASRSGRSGKLIGDVVVDLGFASRDAVEAAVTSARAQGSSTGQFMVDSGLLSADQLARVLSERFGVDYVDLTEFEVDMTVVALISPEAARRYQALPVGLMDGETVLLAMADPTNVLTVDDIAMMTGRRVRPAAASPDDIRALIAHSNRLEDSVEDASEEPEEPPIGSEPTLSMGEDGSQVAPVVKLVHSIIAQAVEQGASDIHFDPEDDGMHVAFRVDGVLSAATTVARAMAPSIVSRVKIMAALDISERRVPQDGRLTVKVEGRRIDLRVVTLPVVGGEAVVMRILDHGVVLRDLDVLGMQDADREKFATAIGRSSGAVLVTGPTGSGKTTTLYAALGLLNSGDRSILTIEDPVESPIVGVKQMQVGTKAGITFATGLRSMLRADPDVIMVGEMRDRETAQIAVQAALTGHMVLSTLHTRDAPSALTRLDDMGVEPFLIASAIDCVVTQRLARQLCEYCKRPTQMPDEVLAEHGLLGGQVHDAIGCQRCARSGYRGRVGLYEVMPMSAELRALVLQRSGLDEVTAMAVSQGMSRLREDGVHKVRAGLTSMEEVTRVASAL